MRTIAFVSQKDGAGEMRRLWSPIRRRIRRVRAKSAAREAA